MFFMSAFGGFLTQFDKTSSVFIKPSSVLLVLRSFEMNILVCDDAEIEDFGLDSLFEEIEDLPEVLIDEQVNYSLHLSSDSFISCVAVPQPGDDFLYPEIEENYEDLYFYLLLFFVIFGLIYFIFIELNISFS